MINEWLRPARRDASGFSFVATDLLEDPTSLPTSADFASLLREAYWGEEYLSNLAGKYGWIAVKDRFLQARSGMQLKVRRGDFGEAIAAQYLKEVEQYHIPVIKLRFKMSTNQTLPGTDCIAIKVNNGQLEEVCYVESKLRTTLDLSVAISGASQLKKDAETAIPEILTFIVRRMTENQDPHRALIEQYIFSRDNKIDTFKLMVFHNSECWDERILRNLQEANIELIPLEVYVAKIVNIVNLSDTVFTALGQCEVIVNDN
jgi:hypothetical protein